MFDIEYLWEFLGKKSVILFGRECASAAIWMCCSLLLRCLCVITGLSKIIPHGLIFSLPYFIQILSNYITCVQEFIPLLLVRIAEGVLGRYHPQRLGFIISAHFFGCLFGAVCFQLICPFHYIEKQVLMPEPIPDSHWIKGIISETILAFIFVMILLVTPDLLEVNRLPKYFLSVPVIPLMLLPASCHSSSFNPAALYAIWYVNGSNTSIHLDHFIGSLIGAVMAGYVALSYFPDDASSWIRKSSSI